MLKQCFSCAAASSDKPACIASSQLHHSPVDCTAMADLLHATEWHRPPQSELVCNVGRVSSLRLQLRGAASNEAPPATSRRQSGCGPTRYPRRAQLSWAGRRQQGMRGFQSTQTMGACFSRVGFPIGASPVPQFWINGRAANAAESAAPDWRPTAAAIGLRKP